MTQDHEFSWQGTLMVFWAITWRCIGIGIPLIFVFSFIFAIAGQMAGMDKNTIMGYANIGGQIVLLPVYIYVLKRLFTKGFGKYRLAVLDKE